MFLRIRMGIPTCVYGDADKQQVREYGVVTKPCTGENQQIVKRAAQGMTTHNFASKNYKDSVVDMELSRLACLNPDILDMVSINI